MQFENGYWKVAQWRGTPVLLHVSLLAWPLFQFMLGYSAVAALLALPAFVVLMGAHEFGHAIMARRRGARAYSIRLYLFHGLCEYEVPWAQLDDVLIAWGGVLAQAVLLLAALALRFLFNHFLPQVAWFLQPVFSVLIGVNCYIALFNLLPIRGLDGRKAWLIVFIGLNTLRARCRQGYAAWSRRQQEKQVKRAAKTAAGELIERIRNK